MAEPVLRVVADAHLSFLADGKVRVAWELTPEWAPKQCQLSYKVVVGDAPNAKMRTLGTTTERFFLDPEDFNLAGDRWYAVVTTDTKTNKRYYTPPQKAGMSWDRNDWRVAREISRAFHARLTKGRAGTQGYHIKRKQSGPVCAECTDKDTGKVIDGSCPACYGTGIQGGYHAALPLMIDADPQKIVNKLDSTQGMLSDIITSFRSWAYPVISPGDYWVNARTGLIYKIGTTVGITAHLRMVPLIQQYHVTEEKTGHIIYTFPTGG